MSFADFENSVDSGRPIELLLVSYLTGHWAFTTSEVPVIHDGRTYEPMPFQHSAIAPTGDVAKAAITISVPQDCQVGELFRIQPPSGVVSLTLFVKHVDDPEAKAVWKGRITNVEWEQPWLHLTSENVFSSLQRLGLRRKYGTACPHTLYQVGPGLCNVNRDTFAEVRTLTGLSGVTLSFTSLIGVRQNGYFAGGFLTWVHGVNGYLERRMITSSDEMGNVVITSPPPGLAVGMPMTLYPGCDHTLATCHGKFNNALNYGGTPYIPKKNPFGGSTLY